MPAWAGERVTVHVPAAAGELGLAEVRRLTTWADLRPYEGAPDPRTPAAHIVVVFVERAPDSARRSDRVLLGLADEKRRLVFVFTRDLDDHLRAQHAARYQVALGRVIAHELEHLRRGKPGHDDRGWFVACLGREDLLSPWFGRE